MIKESNFVPKVTAGSDHSSSYLPITTIPKIAKRIIQAIVAVLPRQVRRALHQRIDGRKARRASVPRRELAKGPARRGAGFQLVQQAPQSAVEGLHVGRHVVQVPHEELLIGLAGAEDRAVGVAQHAEVVPPDRLLLVGAKRREKLRRIVEAAAAVVVSHVSSAEPDGVNGVGSGAAGEVVEAVAVAVVGGKG